MSQKLVQLLVLVVAALFEVGGDALIRAGLRGKGAWLIAIGFLILGSYGLVVFSEAIPSSTWLGLAIVVVGSLVIQCG